MEPLPIGVKLRHPHIRQRLAAQPSAKTTKEHRHIGAHLVRVGTKRWGIRQRPQPIQTISRAIPPQLAAGPTSSLQPGTLTILGSTPPTRERLAVGVHQGPAGLSRRRIQRQQPTSLEDDGFTNTQCEWHESLRGRPNRDRLRRLYALGAARPQQRLPPIPVPLYGGASIEVVPANHRDRWWPASRASCRNCAPRHRHNNVNTPTTVTRSPDRVAGVRDDAHSWESGVPAGSRSGPSTGRQGSATPQAPLTPSSRTQKPAPMGTPQQTEPNTRPARGIWANELCC